MFALASVPRVALRASAPAKQWAAASQSIRHASTLKEAVAEAIPKKQERLKALKAKHSNTSLGDIKLDNLLGGMRGLKVMLWEGSVLDAERGIAFHGKSIPDCEKELPNAKDLGLKGKEMREYPHDVIVVAQQRAKDLGQGYVAAKPLTSHGTSSNIAEAGRSDQSSHSC